MQSHWSLPLLVKRLTNSTLFTRPFLAGRHTWAGHETNTCSLEPRLSIPDFVSQLWNGKPGFKAMRLIPYQYCDVLIFVLPLPFTSSVLPHTRLTRQTIMEDPFIREHIEDLLRNIRTQVLVKLIRPYTRVRIIFISQVRKLCCGRGRRRCREERRAEGH